MDMYNDEERERLLRAMIISNFISGDNDMLVRYAFMIWKNRVLAWKLADHEHVDDILLVLVWNSFRRWQLLASGNWHRYMSKADKEFVSKY